MCNVQITMKNIGTLCYEKLRRPEYFLALPLIKMTIFYLIFFEVLFSFQGAIYNHAWAVSDRIETKWSGQVKQSGSITWQGNKSIYDSVGKGPAYDADINFRLKNVTYFTHHIYSTIHYENIIEGGNIHERQQKLKDLYTETTDNSVSKNLTNTLPTFLMADNTINDNRRFFNLTRVLRKRQAYTIYHRLDRFSLTFSPKWGMIRIGRQAVTWGNGIIFNPMDLFNPFAPADIDRDYKVGDDMVYSQIPLENTGNLQFLYVPRRNGSNGHVEYSSSSAAGKFHTSYKTTEFDIMAAHHYKDFITGIGSTGYFINAAWRLDITWTFPDKDNNFLSMVANMDYSWIWWNKNIYGFAELYFNGSGDDNASRGLADPEIIKRILRGDMFFPGRKYFALGTQLEVNPLVNLYLTLINNIYDYSCIIQPRILWNITENLQITFGGNFYCGGSDTEFGGFKIKNTDYIHKPFNNIYIWWTYFF